MVLLGRSTGVLFLFLAAFAKGECPANFIHLEEGCYHFSQDPLVREEAWNYCLGLGAGISLAVFETCSDFTHVSRYLEIAGLSLDGVNFWTGAYREGDVWTWSDNPAVLTYGAPLWDPYTMVGNSNCAMIGANGGYLTPEDCTTPGYPICEAPLAAQISPEEEEEVKRPRSECPEPFVVVGERCLYINKEFRTWDEARTSCASMVPEFYSDLAVLGDCDSFTNVVRYLEEAQTDITDWLWVGARDFDSSGAYRWIDGDYISPGVPLWCPGQPNNFEEKQHCLMLWGSHFYYAADESCDSKHRSLCEIGL